MFIHHRSSLENYTQFQIKMAYNRFQKQNGAKTTDTNFFLRACLHGVADLGLVGLVSFVFTLWRTQN